MAGHATLNTNHSHRHAAGKEGQGQQQDQRWWLALSPMLTPQHVLTNKHASRCWLQCLACERERKQADAAGSSVIGELPSPRREELALLCTKRTCAFVRLKALALPYEFNHVPFKSGCLQVGKVAQQGACLRLLLRLGLVREALLWHQSQSGRFTHSSFHQQCVLSDYG